ncbi:MAG: DNA-binding protein [Firmicutes bacterium]|nr:DNA-binding protein [Lachnospiraceae bacterium]MBR6970975.1 DNA-binding protein [Bacillota bacterium]
MGEQENGRSRESGKLPIDRKLLLSIQEAAEYSNIGINKTNTLLRAPNCPFVLFVGNKKLVKRKEFEEFIETKLVI